MTETIIIIVIAAAFSIALGKALETSSIPSWAQWAIITAITLIGLVVLQTQEFN